MDKDEYLNEFMNNLVGQATDVNIVAQYIPDDDVWSLDAKVLLKATRNGVDWGYAGVGASLLAPDQKSGSMQLFTNVFQFLSSADFTKSLYESVLDAEERELGDSFGNFDEVGNN